MRRVPSNASCIRRVWSRTITKQAQLGTERQCCRDNHYLCAWMRRGGLLCASVRIPDLEDTCDEIFFIRVRIAVVAHRVLAQHGVEPATRKTDQRRVHTTTHTAPRMHQRRSSALTL